MMTSKNSLQYTFFTRTKTPQAYNISRFCAKGIEANDGTTVTSGCHEEERLGYTLEACFCRDTLCNTGTVTNNRVMLGMWLIAAAFLARLRTHIVQL